MKRRLLSVLCLLSITTIAMSQQALPIKFEVKTWVPEILQSDNPWTYSQDEVIEGKVYRLIQFEVLPGVERISQLAEVGVELLEYYPEHTYLARLDVNTTSKMLRQFDIIAAEPWTSDLKLNKHIINGDIGDWALDGNTLGIVVLYFKGLDPEMVKNSVENAGVNVQAIHPEYDLIKATVDINSIYDIAAIPTLRFISEEEEPGQPEDVEGRSLHRSNMINTGMQNDLNFNASGVAIQVRDDGFLGPHIDYHGRLLTNANGFVNIDHMDMVAGIFAGAGNLNPRAAGMASGADIHATNYQADFLDATLDLHQSEGVMVTNSSYSNGCNAGYTVITRTVDQQIDQNPSLLHVFSAGNSGSSTCGGDNYGAGNRWGNITGGHKQGKNVIATANLRIDISLEGSSSRGPAHDGRIKPDLAARGTAQLSTDPNNAYSPGGGTSAASPGVAGVSAQLYEAYKSLNNGENPPSALIKAALMNTANDLGNKGPDYLYGWGHINAYRAYQLLEQKRYTTGVVGQGNENDHSFTIPDNVKQVRFMLYWRDPAGAIGASKALINDLDMTVFHNGEEYLPYVLDETPDPNTLALPATNGRDRLNNVEQVLFDNPEGGEYTVKVEGHIVPFGAREYFLLVESITDDVSLTYPNGGESFEPGETAQIHWDALESGDRFTIEFSADNGASWQEIGQGSPSMRALNWIVPDIVTAEGQIRVTRVNTSSSNVIPFSIAAVPNAISIKRVCPDYIELEWPAVDGAALYDVYMLGDKFMEIVAETDTNYAQVPVVNVLGDLWFSLRIKTEEGAVGRRMNAISYNEGVKDCSINSDVEVVSLQNPNPYLVYSCGALDEALQLTVRNNGETDITEVSVDFEMNNGLNGAQTFMVDMGPGDEEILTFSDVLDIPTSGNYSIRVEVSTPNDELPGNNIYTSDFRLENLQGPATATPLQEDFESAFPPLGWEVRSELPQTQWERSNIVGPNGGRTNALELSSNVGIEVFSNDEIYTEAVDLSNATTATLSFDYAGHINTNSAYPGNISIVVYSFCEERKVDVLFSSEIGFFQTGQRGDFYPWEPTSQDDWQKILFDLSDYAGSSVVVGWVVENGQSHNIYIDNVNIEEGGIQIPSANYTPSAFITCALFKPVIFEAEDPQQGLEYSWFFGSRASPAGATGPGPHSVRFFDEGTFPVRLSVRDPATGAYAESVEMITAITRPTPNFDFSVNQNEVMFTNTSRNANSYFWDFGDGNTSMEENPTHVYANPGEYEVVLSATNDCDTRDRKFDVSVITVSTADFEDASIRFFPNPVNSVLYFEKTGNTSDQSFQLLDISGKMVMSGDLDQARMQEVGIGHLKSGTYLLKLSSGTSSKSYRIVKF